MKDVEVVRFIEREFNIEIPQRDSFDLEISGYTIDSDEYIFSISIVNGRLKSLNNLINELLKLTKLRMLSLAKNQLSSIQKLKLLPNITHLYLQDNSIKSIKSISCLPNIRHLYLGYNPIKELSVMSKLQKLELLWLSNLDISDLDFLDGLTNLKYLGLGGNKLTDIRKIEKFTNLIELNLVHNYIVDISPLIKLRELTHVSLIENKITSAPYELFNSLKKIKKWDQVFDRNPITNPPVEIIKQGKSAINNYFNQIQREGGKTDYLFEAKLLVIGDGGTGKTTFTRKMLDPNASMPEDKDTTLGIEVGKWTFDIDFPKLPEIGRVTFNVNLWDFGGQKIYQGTHQIFFSDKSFYVLLSDTREQKNDFSYWLNTVQQLGGEGSSLVIVINKKFGHEQKFDESGYRNHFGELIKDIVQLDLSCNDSHILDLQDKVKTYIKQLKGIGDPLPPSWINIRKDLTVEIQNFISFDHFRQICRKHNITDSSMIRTISGYFNRIGTFTHYIDDNLLQERIYLNSNWLVKTVYEVLDNDLSKIRKGRLTENEVKAIWGKNDLQYEVNKLTQLMHKFGLMYHIPNSKSYVVPAHLSTETPYEIWPHEGKSSTLKFIFEFDKYMPQGIMSRLIVALNHHIKDHSLVWYRGLNVELNGAFGEIVEGYGGTNSFDIRIVGSNKIELLTVIRERFVEILSPFKNLHFKQMVPCICSECSSSEEPAFHEYNLLLKFREKGIGSQCYKTGDIVETEKLLKITKIGRASEMVEALSQRKTRVSNVTMFLASSSELKEERDQIEIFVNRLNKNLIKDNVFVELIIWEDFIDHISRTRLQDEYNKAILKADIFVTVVFTKVGKFTAEEFEVAFGEFKNSGRPYVYTYFKDSPVSTGSIKKSDMLSRFDFEEKLRALGHYPTSFNNIDDLKNQFKSQIEKILPKIVF